MTDTDESVGREAARALNRLERRRKTRALVLAVENAETPSDRWLYLDCLLSFADPGDPHRPWPEVGETIGCCLTPAQRKYSSERLKKRREKENN